MGVMLMWNNKYKTVICSVVALALLLGISATGLTAILKNKAEAALGQQPATTETNTKSASSGSDNTALTNGTSSHDNETTVSDTVTASGNTAENPKNTGTNESTEKYTGSTQAGASGSNKTAGAGTNTGSSQSMSLAEIIKSKGLSTNQLQIRLFIDKSDKLLTVYNGNTPLKHYHVELGDSGSGDKSISGDHKTPEGSFYITQKLILNPSDEYLGTRWMRLSYPNTEDAQRGLDSGLIDESTYNRIVSAIKDGRTPPQDTALGGGVGIHGGSTAKLGTNWTYGCTGLTNNDVEDFYNYVRVGTKVTIQA